MFVPLYNMYTLYIQVYHSIYNNVHILQAIYMYIDVHMVTFKDILVYTGPKHFWEKCITTGFEPMVSCILSANLTTQLRV